MKRRGFLKALLGTAGAAIVMGPATLTRAVTPTVTPSKTAACTIPGIQKLPAALVIEGEPNKIGEGIDWLLANNASDARWDRIERAFRMMENEFVRKQDDIAWDMLMNKGSFNGNLVRNAYDVNPCGEIPLEVCRKR